MNSRNVQRSVHAHRIDRMHGDAPNLGPLIRVRGNEPPKGVRREKKRRVSGHSRRESVCGHRERQQRRRLVVVWSLVLLVMALGLLISALCFGLKPRVIRDASVIQKSGEGPVVSRRVSSRFKSPSESEALDRVRGALKIRDPDKVDESFRLGSARPEAVVDFLKNMEAMDGAITGLDWRSSMDANGLLLDGVVVNTKKEGQRRNRLALLTPDENGKWKIDFEAFSRSVNPSWNDLMAMKCDQALVRVMFAKDNYYNGPFMDESKWVCYGMVSPDQDVNLLGYCLRDSPQAVAMARMENEGRPMSGTKALKRVTLEIRRAADAESRQFEIRRVLAEDWVLSAVAFDQAGQ
jgi:hypothetical protein